MANRKKPVRIIDINEQNFRDYENGKSPLHFQSFLNLFRNDMLRQDFVPDNLNKYVDLTKEELLTKIKNPIKYWKDLVEISRYAYYYSGYYRRLINHFAYMSTLNYTISISTLVDPYDDVVEYSGVDKRLFLSKYNAVVYMLDKMSIEHELKKIFNVVFRDGIYFGYMVTGKESTFFRQLNPYHCRISGIKDGCFTFEVNLSVIDTITAKSLPDDIQVLYQQWVDNGKKGSQWVQLDEKKAICLKTDDDSVNIYPMFIYLLADIMDIEDFKDLQKTDGEIDNYRLLVLKIPVNEKDGEKDGLLISQPVITNYTQIAMQAVDEHVGILTTPMEAELLQSKSNNVDKDRVKSATNVLYKNAGSQLLNNESNIGLAYSLEADAAIVYVLQKSFERWFNRKIKLERRNPRYCSFKLSFLEQTVYNRQKVIDMYTGVVERSVPALPELAASVGITPAKIEGNHYLQNILFDMTRKWEPSKTAFTQSPDDKNSGGYIDDITTMSPEGIDTRERDANNPDARN